MIKRIKRFLFYLRHSIGIIFSLVLLLIMLNQSKLKFSHVAEIKDGYIYLIYAILSFVIAVWLQSKKMKILWLPAKNIHTYSSLLVGNIYNCLLPGNIGEGIRAMHFSRKNRLPFIASIASQILEKYIDAILFLFPCSIWFIWHGWNNHYFEKILLSVCVVIIIVSIISVPLLLYKSLVKVLIGYIPFSTRRFRKWIYSLYHHFRFLLFNMIRRKTYISFSLVAYVIFGLNILQFCLVMKCINLPIEILSLESGFFIALSMVIIVFVPSAPSNAGVIHFGLYQAMLYMATVNYFDATQIKPQLALFSVLVHISFVLPEIIIGSVYIFKERKYIF